MNNSMQTALSENEKIKKLLDTVQTLNVQNKKLDTLVCQLEQESYKTKLKRKIKHLVLTSAHEFTGHGILNLFSSNSMLGRLIWILILIGMLILCIFYIINSTDAFLRYDVISNKKINIQNQVAFPAVIICALNSDFPIDTAIFQCTFNGKDCKLLSSTLFKKVSIVGYDLLGPTYCIKFNENRLLSVNKAGYEFGLFISFLMPANLKVYYGVFENSEVIRSDEMSKGLTLGQGYIISIKKKILNRLSEPYNDCVDSVKNSLSDEIELMGSEYRQNLCYSLCIMHQMEKACQIVLPKQLSFGVNDTNNTVCVQEVIDTFDFQKNCRICPQKCKIIVYDSESSQEKMGKYGHFFPIISTKLNETEYEKVADRLIALNINFESLSTEVIDEVPKITITNLVANLGGTVGVFLGLSVASFLEIFSLFFKIVYLLVKKNT